MATICETHLARYVGPKLAEFLSSFFFRSLGHDWTNFERIGENGGEAHCRKCGRWHHFTERRSDGFLVDWKWGAHPDGPNVELGRQAECRKHDFAMPKGWTASMFTQAWHEVCFHCRAYRHTKDGGRTWSLGKLDHADFR